MNPIMLDFPEEIDSNRLIIRAPRWGDGKEVNEAVHESLGELEPWLPFARSKPTVEDTEAYVRKARLNFLERTDLVLHIYNKESKRFIGSSGLHRYDWYARRFEIGYWLRTSEVGNGYMTEAVNSICDFAISQLLANRMEIRCNSRNTSSIRVAQKTGFLFEGTLRKYGAEDEFGSQDVNVYSKVKGTEFK
jgi:ribosomal-protein-serine acetyltransferase